MFPDPRAFRRELAEKDKANDAAAAAAAAKDVEDKMEVDEDENTGKTLAIEEGTTDAEDVVMQDAF